MSGAQNGRSIDGSSMSAEGVGNSMGEMSAPCRQLVLVGMGELKPEGAGECPSTLSACSMGRNSMRNEGGTGRTCPELNVNHGRSCMRMSGLSATGRPCPALCLMSLSMELKHGECCKAQA